MTVKEAMQQIYKHIFVPKMHQAKEIKYVKEAAIILLLAGASMSGFYLYRSWKLGGERAAQKAFAECLQEYQRAFQGSDEAWSEVAMVSKIGYERHGSTNIGPFFLGLQADALAMDSKKQEALELLNQMINKLSTSNPMLNLYKTKRALIKLDSTNMALQREARKELESLAHDENNKNADQAYYYLGYDYWVQDKADQAQKIWHELISKFKKDDPKASSMWALLAEQKMQQIA